MLPNVSPGYNNDTVCPFAAADVVDECIFWLAPQKAQPDELRGDG